MNKYESYKKVNLPWLNEIPSHWGINYISHIFKERNEKNTDLKIDFILSVTKNKGVIPYYEKGNIGNKSSNDISNYKIVYPNDLVLNSMNMVIGSLGKSKYKGVLSQVYYVLQLNDLKKYNIDYLTYVFKNSNFYESLKVLGKGILDHRLRVPMELLKYEKLPIPPIDEQNQIANYLDWKINEIDKLILVEKEKIKQLEKEKCILIANKYKSLNKKIRLKMLISEPLLYGLNEVGKTNGKIRFVRITDIDKMGNLKCENNLYIENCNEKFLLNFGDILFARSGATVGKSYLHLENDDLMAFAGYLIRARLNQNLVLPEFVYYYTQSESYRIWKDSMFIKSTIQNISAEKYNNLEIPFVNINEQNIIVNEIKNIVTLINNNNSFINQKINQLQLLKQSLIAEVVTGKIDVRDVVIPKYEKSTIIEEDEIEEMEV